MFSSTRRGLDTSGPGDFRSSLRSPEPFGSLETVGRLAVDAFGVERREREEVRGFRPGRGGRGPGPDSG